ncbi:hypothetical protein GCM10023161_06720 [Mycobacterium paraffinicum]|uniref:Uncharacterized protein n=1 Tax=Mycobacterium paraffinicum TaxID=53378 RepID=A0ABP8RC49_9MYCO
MELHELSRRNLTIAHQLRQPRHPGKAQALIINGGHVRPFAPTPRWTEYPAECTHTLTDAAEHEFMQAREDFVSSGNRTFGSRPGRPDGQRITNSSGGRGAHRLSGRTFSMKKSMSSAASGTWRLIVMASWGPGAMR